jgi:HlyD family secretion protein
MAGTTSIAVLRDIQTLFDVGTLSGLTDRQLLECFASGCDKSSDAAFEILVLRHGPMVLRVCRNLLREEADAADAFQATFLVLVRRRATIRRLESVGGWLYGVACRVAARARVDAARRQRAEHRGALRVVEAVDPADNDAMAKDFGPVVQEEVRRLPEKFRAVVVLCYWQTLTHEQAAAQLGCPLGTVRSRLARARKLLHRRLTRRGLAPLAGMVATAIEGSSASGLTLGAVPPALVKETIRAAVASASGQALSYVVSGAAASLVRRVLWSMTMIKIKTAAVGLALVGFLGLGAAFVAFNGRPGQAQVTAGAGAPKVEPAQDPPGTALLYSTPREAQTILALVPHGSIVKKGDVVCELDPAEISESWINQRISSIRSGTAHRRNQAAREIAELNLVEYAEGLFKLQVQEVQAALKKAEADLAIAEDEFAAKKTGKEAAARDNARLALEIAQTRKRVLLDYTRGRTIKELKLAIEIAHADELASKDVSELQALKEKRLSREVDACKIVAPRDGKIIYYYGPEGTKPRIGWKADGSTAPFPFIEVGAQVHPHQLLFKIVPVTDAANQAK